MQGPIQSLEYNQNVVYNEPKNMIFYYSRRCNDCSIFSKTLNHFLSLNVDEKGRPIYNVQSVCIDRKNPHHLPSVLRFVPAIIYNQRIYQGKEAFEWINDFTSSKTFESVSSTSSKKFVFASFEVSTTTLLFLFTHLFKTSTKMA